MHPLPTPLGAGLSAVLLGGFLWSPGSVSAQEFRPLFDGKTLKGWHLQGSGEWKALDGILVGTHAASDNVFGHLVSDSSFGDFAFRYRWKLVKGNSGLYFRSAEGGSAGMIGPQVEMDAAFPGGIYTTNTDPWGWVSQPKSADIGKWYRAGDWNLVTVTAKGPKVTVTYNGIQTAETSDARLPLKGRFGFQIHAGLDCVIHVDDVEAAWGVPTGLGSVLPGNGAGNRAALAVFSTPGFSDWTGGRLFRLDGSAWNGPVIRVRRLAP